MQTIDILLLGVAQLWVDEKFASNQMSTKLKMSEITLCEIFSIHLFAGASEEVCSQKKTEQGRGEEC